MTSRIIGTGSCLPERIVTNDDLAAVMDTSDEWISSRTGIRSRHLAVGETTTALALEASLKAVDNAGMKPQDLDLIFVATVTGDYVTPSTACLLQDHLGAENAVAMDVNAACSGFLFALYLAHLYLQAGGRRTALVVGAETLSRIMDWNDRSTCVLFGDGAGAAVVRADETGLMGYDQGSDGAGGMTLACPGRPNQHPFMDKMAQEEAINKGNGELRRGPGYVHMEGQEVYKFAVTTVPASITRALEQARLRTEDIDYFILHQANARIIQSVAKRLKAPIEKFPMNLASCGNLSAGSVPVLLDEMNRKGLLHRGCRVVLSGFGAGLTWGSAVFEW